MKNERNAGRNPKFKVSSKMKLIPEILEKEVDKISEPYLFTKNVLKTK